MAENTHSEAFKQIIDCLHGLDADTRTRVLKAAAVYFGIDSPVTNIGPSTVHIGQTSSATDPRTPVFGDRSELPPKDFIHQKSPITDVERVACLAYYLTHYRGAPYFKTLDISALNTEAAQLKFSNTAFAVSNAAAAGLIVPAGKGNKQLSALGEKYVDALPDRDAAKEIMSKRRLRPRKKRSRNSTSE